MKKQYISEIIGKDYQQWNNENIIIKSGTNTGKSTFICDILVPWAASQNKTVLYLVNRKVLEDQIKIRLSGFANVTVLNYQTIESLFQQDIHLGYFDYIVCDECHYFQSDSDFNNNTDYSLRYIRSSIHSVIIWMSATADNFYKTLPKCKQYDIGNKYEGIEAIYFYKQNQLPEIIRKIIQDNQDDKIIVFVNSIKRLCEMYYTFGDKASYMCSKANRKAKSYPFIQYDTVSNCTFDKQILFTTKAMDNGIDIKDPNVKHVISEIFDIESAIQAIGRKRPVNQDDKYKVYFMSYGGRAVNLHKQRVIQQIKPIRMYLSDKALFYLSYQHNKQLLKHNNAFYGDFDNSSDEIGTIKINNVYYEKLQDDLETFKQMQQSSYDDVLMNRLGLSDRVRKLKIDADNEDAFLTYLKSLQGVKLFKDEQKELKEAFRLMLGLNDRWKGYNVLNGKLKDCNYPYEIESRQETKGERRKQRYWTIKEIV